MATETTTTDIPLPSIEIVPDPEASAAWIMEVDGRHFGMIFYVNDSDGGSLDAMVDGSLAASRALGTTGIPRDEDLASIALNALAWYLARNGKASTPKARSARDSHRLIKTETGIPIGRFTTDTRTLDAWFETFDFSTNRWEQETDDDRLAELRTAAYQDVDFPDSLLDDVDEAGR